MTDKSMSQEEIDALLAGMSGDAPAAGTPAAAVPAAAPGNPPGGMVVDQGELDALLSSLTGETDDVPAPNGPVNQGELDALLAQLDTGSTSEPLPAQTTSIPATPGKPLGQDDIDSILASLEGPANTPPAAKPAAPAVVDGPLGQDAIDALLNSMGDAPAPAAAPAAAAAPADGPLGQDAIDALLSSMGDAPAPTPAAAAAAAPAEGPLGQDAIDALLSSMGDAPAAPAPSSSSKAQAPAVASAAAALPAGKLGQDDIDSLLNSLGAEQISVGASKPGDSKSIPATPGTTSRGNLALSTEDLSALVTKHGAPSTGEPADGMIDQGDIDALVKQLGAATGTMEAPGEKPSMTEELAKHDAAIDQLLAGGKGPSGSAVTMDAIDFKGMSGDKGPGTSGVQRGMGGPAYTVNVPVLTPPELRGARWLLAAAVLLLAICAGTLVVVAGAVRTLGTELARERANTLEPGDDYGTDFAAALARLSSPDEDQVATGVLFLQRLRKRSPSHDGEIGLALARHFRSHGAWKEAGREYAAVVDDPKAISDDPRVLVEYADTLRQLDDRDGARRQLYALLADEARWTGRQLSAQTAERNRHTLVEAHLLLARLLDGAPAPTLAAAEPGHAAEGGHGDSHAAGGHGAAAPAAEHGAGGHH